MRSVGVAFFGFFFSFPDFQIFSLRFGPGHVDLQCGLKNSMTLAVVQWRNTCGGSHQNVHPSMPKTLKEINIVFQPEQILRSHVCLLRANDGSLPTETKTDEHAHKRNTQMALVSLAKLLHKYYKHTHRLDPEKVRAEQEAATDSEEEEEDSHKEKDKEETEEEETENDSANEANNISLPILCCHNCGESFAGRDYVIRVPGAFRAHKIWDSTAELCQSLRGITPVRHRDMLEAIRNREQSDIDVRVHASVAHVEPNTTTTHCENENGSTSGSSSDDNDNEEEYSHSVDNDIVNGDDSDAAVGDGWKSCFSSPKYIHLHCWQYWYFRPCGTMFERKGLDFRGICILHSKINEWQKLYNQRVKHYKRFEEQEQKKKQRLEAKQQKERERELKRSERLRLREQKKAKSSSSSGSGTTTRRRTTRSSPSKVTLSADNELQTREEGEEQHDPDHPDEDEESKSKRIKLDDAVTNREVSLQNCTATDTGNDDPYLLNLSSDIWVQIISFLRVPFLVHSLSLTSKSMHYYVNLEYTWSVLATVNLSRDFNSVRTEYYGHMSARESYRASHKHFCESC